MYGELTDKETVTRLEFTLENQQQDQFEVLLYKKNSKYLFFVFNIFLNLFSLEIDGIKLTSLFCIPIQFDQFLQTN